ncbi:hypothetical protein JRY02_20665 [Enterobacter roggenkampii]|nr:hypothetical protein [Enterobacter roggenkampii]
MEARKVLFITVFITLSMIIALSVYYLNTPLSGKTCTGQIAYRVSQTGGDPSYIIEHAIKFGTVTSGYDNIRGEFFKGMNKYKISRTLQFSLTSLESNTLLEYRIGSVHKFSDDTMPEELTNKYMTFLAANVSRMIHIQKLGHGLLLISDTGGPSFVCQSQ